MLALLRMPILLVTHRLDGRLTQLSILLALVVLLTAGAALYERVARMVRPDLTAIGRGEQVLAFLAGRSAPSRARSSPAVRSP